MAINGYIRATGNIDIFVEPTIENSQKVISSLIKFGAPLMNIEARDFFKEGTVYQMGLPPLRIDIITKVDGLTFEEAISDSIIYKISNIDVPFLSLEKLIINKNSTGREKDKGDVEELKKVKKNEQLS